MFIFAAAALIATAAAPSIDDSRVQGKLLPVARAALARALADAGLLRAVVTSTERSVRRQIELMLPQFRVAAAGRRKLVYGPMGQAVYQRWRELRAARPRPSRAKLQAALERRLQELLDEHEGPRNELQHLAGGATAAFDVAPWSIADRAAFEAAVRRSALFVRCIFPGQGTEQAYHLEVFRDGAPAPEADCNRAFR